MWDWHTRKQTDATSMRFAFRVWLPVRVCVFALSLCVSVVCVFCVQLCTVSLCESLNPCAFRSACVCDGGEGVCVLSCAVKLCLHFFLLTFVVSLGYFLPCCHITILHTHWFWVWSSSLVETQLILSYTATEAWWRDKMWCSTSLRVNTKVKRNKLCKAYA